MDNRQQLLHNWLNKTLNCDFSLKPLPIDASHRRYFRVQQAKASFIAMDAPPTLEDSRPFLAIANTWHAAGIQVPTIYQHDLEQGFLLLEDFGDNLLLNIVKHERSDELYRKALQDLHAIQCIPAVANDVPLPAYDGKFLLKELNFFTKWCLEGYLKLSLSDAQRQMLQHSYQLLVTSACEQPQVCVHRDYHSRNLMVLANDSIGIIDFQDAMLGPITYDAVSLLRDCYIVWPQQQVMTWLEAFYQHTTPLLPNNTSFEQFTYWFDLMGVQRHLKAIYRFAYKFVHDGRDEYLADIPRALDYVMAVCARITALQPLQQFLQQQVISQLETAL